MKLECPDWWRTAAAAGTRVATGIAVGRIVAVAAGIAAVVVAAAGIAAGIAAVVVAAGAVAESAAAEQVWAEVWCRPQYSTRHQALKAQSRAFAASRRSGLGSPAGTFVSPTT